MTTEQEAALREALEKATPGPWTALDAVHETWAGEGDRVMRKTGAGFIPQTRGEPLPADDAESYETQFSRIEDAKAAALAINSLPDLLSSLAAERAAREKAEAERDEARAAIHGTVDLVEKMKRTVDEWQPYAERLERGADLTMAEEIQRLRREKPEADCLARDATARADALAKSVEALEEGLSSLVLSYVTLLEIDRDRIIALGGSCDPVDVMEKNDPALRRARSLLNQEPKT